MTDDTSKLPLADYGEIFLRYGPVILAYLRAQASTPEEAEDLTLDVFTDALAQADIISWNCARQLGWLRRVATNKLIDSYQRRNRRPVVALEQITETLFAGPDPEFMAQRNEDHAYLHEQIKQLSAEQQQLLQLRYSYGLRTAEIAELLKKSEPAVRKMLSRTISQLRTLYDVETTHKGKRL